MKVRAKKHPVLHRMYTYLFGRKCEYCSEPIEDQAQISRKHCLPWVDEYGQQQDCRRAKHSMIHSRETVLLQELNAKLKETDRSIKRLLTHHGDYVGTEILDAYNIQLDECIRFHPEENGIVAFEFLSYVIKTDIIKRKHKIILYEQQ